MRYGGIDSLHRELDVLCTVSSAAANAQADWVQSCLAQMIGEGDSVLVVQRQYDATPARVRFGQLQGQLEPHARYPS